MIEPAPLNTKLRRTQDISEVEALAYLFTQLELAIDTTACEHFEKLIELAGTKEFIPAISRIRQSLYTYKHAKEGIFGLGYIVPTKQLINIKLKPQKDKWEKPSSPERVEKVPFDFSDLSVGQDLIAKAHSEFTDYQTI